jgi:hypothetical protein
MITPVRAFYLIGIVLLLIGTISLTDAAADDGLPSPSSLYEYVLAMAGKGDTEAQQQITRLNDFCADVGAGNCSSLPKGAPVKARDEIEGVVVQVDGLQPFWLKVYPETEFRTIADVDSYISKRKAALNNLAAKDPVRLIEVSISPADYMSVSSFWGLKAKYGLDVDELGTNWLDSTGTYGGAMNVADPRELGEVQRVDFTASGASVESQLKQQLSAMPQPPNRTLVPAGLTPKVRWVRGTLTAQNAAKLAADPAIMLVDPVTDIYDTYRTRALDVRVVDMPQVLISKKRILGTL